MPKNVEVQNVQATHESEGAVEWFDQWSGEWITLAGGQVTAFEDVQEIIRGFGVIRAEGV